MAPPRAKVPGPARSEAEVEATLKGWPGRTVAVMLMGKGWLVVVGVLATTFGSRESRPSVVNEAVSHSTPPPLLGSGI